MHQSRTFRLLIGTGIVLALLLGLAVFRTVLAGCPDGGGKIDLACFFLPTHADLGIHLLSYAFMGTILLSTYSWLVLWRRQWSNTRALTANLGLLCGSSSELKPLTWRLGLKDKVRLLDTEVPFCFCSGFISPRVYLSRGMVEKLEPQELEALLLHEKHHLENYDVLKILLGRLVVAALFFIPVLRDILEHYLIDKEIAADRSAIWYQGHSRGIAGALAKLLQEHSTIPAEGLAVGGAEALSYRIDHLMGHASQRGVRIPIPHLVTSFIIITLIIVAIVAPLSGSHPLNGDMASTLFGYLA